MITPEQLRQMAVTAQENFLFDEDTDPDGYVAKGLEYLAREDNGIDQELIDEWFGDDADFESEAVAKWDRLEERAKYYGAPVR